MTNKRIRNAPVTALSPSKSNRVTVMCDFHHGIFLHLQSFCNGEWHHAGGIPLDAEEAQVIGKALIRLAKARKARK
jgi:hypothetical protein